MPKKPRSVIIKVPTAFNIGPVPEDVQGHNGLLAFALAHTAKIISATGVETKLNGDEATITYVSDNALKTYAATGRELSNRHFRVDERENGLHALEVSTDGQDYVETGLFNDADFAALVGEAWVAGKVEPRP